MSKWTPEYQEGYEAGYKRALEDLKTKLVVGQEHQEWTKRPVEVFNIINEMKEF